MSIIIDPWYFANYADNLPVTPGTLYGTTVTPGLSNADSSGDALITAVAFDVHYMVVGFAGYAVSAAAEYALADILLDPAGGTAWRTFIDDLVIGFARTQAGLITYGLYYHFPIFIKSGTSIGCRARTSHTAAPVSPRVVIYAYGNPSRPDAWWCGSGVETLGVTPATSTAVSVTPGNTGAFGSWATIGTSTARYGSLQWGMNGTDSNATALFYYFQVGYNNVQIPGVPTMSANVSVSEDVRYSYLYGPAFCDIPSGTAIQVRGTCSGTAEVWAGGAAVYGVY